MRRDRDVKFQHLNVETILNRILKCLQFGNAYKVKLTEHKVKMAIYYFHMCPKLIL